MRASLASGVIALLGGIVAFALLLESGVLTARILGIANRFLGPATSLRLEAKAVRWRPWSGISLGEAKLFSSIPATANSRLAPSSPADSAHPVPGGPLLSVERLEAGYDFLGLASSSPRIRQVHLVRPEVDLQALLQWNAHRPRRDPANKTRDSTGVGIRIDDFRITEGVFTGQSGLKLSGIRIRGMLDGTRDNWNLELAEVTTRLRRGPIDERLEGKGRLSLTRSALAIEEIALHSGEAELKVRGLLYPEGVAESNVTVDGSSVALERVGRWFGTQHPLLEGNLSFRAHAEGRLEDLRFEGRFVNERLGREPEDVNVSGSRQGKHVLVDAFRLQVGERAIQLQGEVELQDEPRFDAFARFSQWDPMEVFADADTTNPTRLNGTARVVGRGFSRETFVGNADVQLGSSVAHGVAIDSAELGFSGEGGALDLRQASIMRGGTTISGHGHLGSDDVVEGEFRGVVRDLADLAGIIPEVSTSVLQGEANALVTIRGPLQGPSAEATLEFADASILGAKAKTLWLSVASEKLGKDVEANVELRGTDVGYKAWLVPEGTATLVVGTEGAKISELRAISQDRGELALVGEIEFKDDDQIKATIRPLQLRSPDGKLSWSNVETIAILKNSEGTRISGIDLRSGDGRVFGEVDVRSGQGTHLTLTGNEVALEDFTSYFKLPKPLAGKVNLVADLQLAPDAVLGDLNVDLVKGSWGETQLEKVAATLVCRPGAVDVNEITVRSSLVDFTLSGLVGTGGRNVSDLLGGAEVRNRLIESLHFDSLRVQAAAPSLDEVRERLSWFPSPGGRGTLTARIEGPSIRPLVQFDVEILDAELGTKPLDRLAFSGHFADSLATIDSCQVESEDGVGRVEAAWPLAWSLAHPEPEWVHDRLLRLHVTAERFPVGTLAEIDTLFAMGSGPFWAEATMTGTLNDPFVDGAFRVEDGKLTLPLFDRSLNRGVVSGRLHTKGIDIPSFTFGDGWGDGEAKGRARIDFDRLKIVDYTVDVWADDFRYRGFAGIDATGDGTLSITPREITEGKDVPHFVGKFDMSRADLDERIMIKPSEARKAPPGVVIPGEDDSTRVVVEVEAPAPPPPVLLMDLSFAGKKNLWLRTREIDLEFAGEITFHATPEYMGITGETHSLRGTYSFLNTKFDIERGEIEYTDPRDVGASYIDCTASTTVLEEEVDVHVSGTLANPVVESTSASGYSEADIFRLLALRIKRTDPNAPALEAQSDFSQDLLASWGSLVASRFGRNIALDLGLDTFDVDVNETSSRVGFGKYFGSDFFLKYKQQVRGIDSPSETVTEEAGETPERQLLLEYRLSKIFRLQGETGTISGDGYLNLDLMAEWGY